AVKRENMLLPLPREKESLFRGRVQCELIALFVRHIPQLAFGEILALRERDLEPGVIALEVPLPVHRLDPEAALLLLARAFPRAGRPPGADQVGEGLQGLPRSSRLLRRREHSGARQYQQCQKQSGHNPPSSQPLSPEAGARGLLDKLLL